jgi:hypothetical protein
MPEGSEPANFPSEITIVFEKSKDKVTVPATGAFGGPTPDGASVVANIFVEYASIPSYVTHEVGEGGRVSLDQGKPVRRGEITREVQATLVMNPENARQLGDWLVKNSEQALRKRGDDTQNKD